MKFVSSRNFSLALQKFREFSQNFSCRIKISIRDDVRYGGTRQRSLQLFFFSHLLNLQNLSKFSKANKKIIKIGGIYETNIESNFQFGRHFGIWSSSDGKVVGENGKIKDQARSGGAIFATQTMIYKAFLDGPGPRRKAGSALPLLSRHDKRQKRSLRNT